MYRCLTVGGRPGFLAPEAKELTRQQRVTLLFPVVSKADQCRAVDKGRPAIIEDWQACLDPAPDGLFVHAQRARCFIYGIAPVFADGLPIRLIRHRPQRPLPEAGGCRKCAKQLPAFQASGALESDHL